MASESDRTYEFIFTWSIHNFSHLALEEDVGVESPKFVVEFMKNSEFHLCLFTRDPNYPGFIGCYIFQQEDNPTFSYRISIRQSDGVFEDEESETEYLPPNSGEDHLVHLNDLCNYLENDTLTIRCWILKKDAEMPKSVMCCASTKIKVLNLDYAWTLDDIIDIIETKIVDNVESKYAFKTKINETADVSTFSLGIPGFKLWLSSGLNLEDDDIHFVIESLVNSRTFFLVFVIQLLDANGSVAHTVKGRVLFEELESKRSLDLSFVSKTKLLSNDKLYLPNGKLNIQCKFSISTTDAEYEISSVQCRSFDNILIKPYQASIALPVGYELWVENARKFFTEERCSDFIIRSADKDFPVHKAILAAQSEVFCAMFEHDTKERNTGVVEIEDLENYMILKLLTYIYTNKLEDMDVPLAQKLFFAADRYGVTELLRICSSYLASHIDASNVCELLVLADTHQDAELKSCVEDFIFDHARDILNSEDWKNVMKTHSHLSSETLQRIFCKKML